MPIKFLLLGGVLEFFKNGWKCQFYFYGHEDFSEGNPEKNQENPYTCERQKVPQAPKPQNVQTSVDPKVPKK